LIPFQKQQLLRAEDDSVPYWQVTLAPIFRLGVAPSIEGLLPDGSFATGDPRCTMTWGGGGVNFRTAFTYPVQGSSFVVAGDNVMLEVEATSPIVVTPDNTPVASAWVAPTGVPTSQAPLLDGTDSASALVTTRTLSPFARAIHLIPSVNPQIFTYFFLGGAALGGPNLATVNAPLRIPIPSYANSVTVSVPAFGVFGFFQELVFT
jgi:hypothetical protein